jgi:hypothetical protein
VSSPQAITKEKNMAITWHNNTFKLKLSVVDSPVDIKNPPAKNRFKFKPLKDANDEIYLYRLQPHSATDMKTAWSKCSQLLPQPGAPLTWALADDDKLDPGDPQYPQKLKALVSSIKEQKIDDPALTFERLVGTVRGDDADNPIAFYRVPNVFKDQNRILLIALVNLVNGGSPVGTVAADS